MDRKYWLQAYFGRPVVPLTEICEEFFGMNIKTAQQKIKAMTFPLPTYRMDESSQRSPYLVDVDVLAEYMEKRSVKAVEKYLTARKNLLEKKQSTSTLQDKPL